MTPKAWSYIGLAYCLLLAAVMVSIGLFFLTVDPPIGWIMLAAFGLYSAMLSSVWCNPDAMNGALIMKLKKGIYETSYGNAAYVSGPAAKTAYDLDMAERIPISEVTRKFLRKAEPTDSPSYRYLD